MKKRLACLFSVALVLAAALYFRTDLTRLLSGLLGEETKSYIQSVVDTFAGEPKEVTTLRSIEVAAAEDGFGEYYFHQLSQDDQLIYRQMLLGVRSGEESFYLTTADQERIFRVFQAVSNDHPELYNIRNHNTNTTTIWEGEDYCLYSPGYLYTQEEQREIEGAMEAAYQQVVSLLPEGCGDYEKARIVYTYVIDQTEYQSGPDDQSIAGVFWKNQAVCAGYAAAVQYLLERLGVPSIYVTGDILGSDVGHAWNIVTLEGQYYYIDATNGDQPDFLEGDAVQLSEHKTTLYDYLCPFPEEYEVNYTASATFSVPQVTAHDLNFYVMNQACFDTYDYQSVYNLCQLRIDNQAAVVRFKFGTQEAFDAAYVDWVEGNGPSEVAQYYMKANQLSYVQYHQGVLPELKTIYYIY